MNSAFYQKMLRENVWPSVCELKLKLTWVWKHQLWMAFLKKGQFRSPDSNLIEMLGHDLKQAVHAKGRSNVVELQLVCKEGSSNVPPQPCKNLMPVIADAW